MGVNRGTVRAVMIREKIHLRPRKHNNKHFDDYKLTNIPLDKLKRMTKREIGDYLGWGHQKLDVRLKKYRRTITQKRANTLIGLRRYGYKKSTLVRKA